jgi:RNA polymerase sigma-70 factor (ECF subfamily)
MWMTFALQTPGMDGEPAVSLPRPSDLDAQRFSELFRAEFPYVSRTLRRLGVRAGDLDDKAHDVFVAVYQHRSEYDPGRPVRPWLFGFAFRMASDYGRSAWRRRAVYDDTAEPAAVVPDVAQRLDDERNWDVVLAALDTLDLDRRAVFVLSDIDAVASAEIAATLSIPLGTVYSRLRLARADFTAAVTRLRLQRGER